MHLPCSVITVNKNLEVGIWSHIGHIQKLSWILQWNVFPTLSHKSLRDLSEIRRIYDYSDWRICKQMKLLFFFFMKLNIVWELNKTSGFWLVWLESADSFYMNTLLQMHCHCNSNGSFTRNCTVGANGLVMFSVRRYLIHLWKESDWGFILLGFSVTL